MARLRSITEDQAVRLFPGYDKQAVEAVLNKGVKYKYIARTPKLIPVAGDAKVRKGKTPVREVTIYYMTTKGKALLRRCKIKVRFLKTSRPVGVHGHRLYHDLIIVETLIWWQENYKIVGFLVEDELRSKEENPADLRIILPGEDDQLRHVDCEIVVQNHVGDIIQKDNGMMWFTPSLRQADIIDDMKRDCSVVQIDLGGVVKKTIAPSRALAGIELDVVEALRQNGGALTAGAVAACLHKDRAKMSSVLKRLVGAGHLVSATVQSSPGVKKGRPHKVYAADPCFIDLKADRDFILRVSALIVYLSRFGHSVSKIYRETETVLITGKLVNMYITVSDDIEDYTDLTKDDAFQALVDKAVSMEPWTDENGLRNQMVSK